MRADELRPGDKFDPPKGGGYEVLEVEHTSGHVYAYVEYLDGGRDWRHWFPEDQVPHIDQRWRG